MLFDLSAGLANQRLPTPSHLWNVYSVCLPNSWRLLQGYSLEMVTWHWELEGSMTEHSQGLYINWKCDRWVQRSYPAQPKTSLAQKFPCLSKLPPPHLSHLEHPFLPLSLPQRRRPVSNHTWEAPRGLGTITYWLCTVALTPTPVLGVRVAVTTCKGGKPSPHSRLLAGRDVGPWFLCSAGCSRVMILKSTLSG